MDAYFGFTKAEVTKILHAYALRDYEKDFKVKYDGYRFGAHDIYHPSDALSATTDCVQSLSEDGTLVLYNYWMGAGENLNLHRLLGGSGRILLKECRGKAGGERGSGF